MTLMKLKALNNIVVFVLASVSCSGQTMIAAGFAD